MDKNSKRILKRMKNISAKTDYYYGFSLGWGSSNITELAKSINMNVEDCRANIRYLKEAGYIEYSKTVKGDVIGFHLSHKGLHRKEFRRIDIAKYILDKWIDFLALLVAIIALIVSIVAIAKP